MKLSVHQEIWPVARPFRIAGREWTSFESVVVELAHDGAVGRGEALGIFYFGETSKSLAAQVEQVAEAVVAGIDRAGLQLLLPPGGARNALDCALWDLEAKTSGKSVWDLAGVAPKALDTVYTISIEADPEQMAEHAAAASAHTLLKVKLDAHQPLERIRAIRRARQDAHIVVDANQAWTFEQLECLAPAFADLGVQMIEQPLPRGADAVLEGYRAPVLLGADESCLHRGELAAAAKRYQMINVKLDKTGGLTHALELVREARGLGLGLMVGSMAGSSLAMAPAFVIGCLVDLVDIDGPLLLKRDRLPGMRYTGGRVDPPGPELWG
jgi:L-alanine-DL-glutamate epimerase-like enolase superfamily enzyme